MERHWTAQLQREQLHRAARDGDLARVRQLLAAKYPVNRFDGLGKTPLHYAVAGEHLDMVEVLLRAGARVNSHDESRIGDTALGETQARALTRWQSVSSTRVPIRRSLAG